MAGTSPAMTARVRETIGKSADQQLALKDSRNFLRKAEIRVTVAQSPVGATRPGTASEGQAGGEIFLLFFPL
jgi:hypothetical protein